MQTKRNAKQAGNVLICVLGTILIVSIIGANVLRNSTTRLNASSSQVRAWKEALSAAEAGGDIAFAELRKQFSGATQWADAEWTNSNFPPGYPKGTKHVSKAIPPLGNSNLRSETVVETCYFDGSGNFQLGAPPLNVNAWSRVRSKGTAPLQGLKRTGMDDTLSVGGTHFATNGSARGKGDSLLRKIDFQYDHFVASYGPNGDGLFKAQVVVAPSISRRIEQIVTPVSPFFDAAIRSAGSFYGLGSAGKIDSYDSRVGPYVFVANDPTNPRYPDSRHGSVQIGSATATVKGTVYGDVATNGGSIVGSSQITGTIDNNVPFVLEDYAMPNTAGWAGGSTGYPPGSGPGQLPAAVTSTKSLTPPVGTDPANPGGSASQPNYYVISSLDAKLTVNPVGTAETYVAIRVTGDISGNTEITVNPKVHLKIYFDHDIDVKSNKLVNQNPSLVNPNAANLQFYGISPPRDANKNPLWTQSIKLDSGTPSTLAMTFYAPGADIEFKGNPDFIGTMVCKSFFSNGNVNWHYDRALNDEGVVLNLRIASYIEDTR